MPLSRAPKTRLGRLRMLALMVCIPLLLAAFHPVQELLLSHQVLHNPDVRYSQLEQFAAIYEDPTDAVEALWDTGWLAHRHFAIEWLYRQRAPYAQMRPYMIRALQQPDADLRETAMLWLTAHGNGENLPLIPPLLQDADPRIARYAAVLISRYGEPRHAAWLFPLLDDEDEIDYLIAFGAYEKWSGEDDGVARGSSPADLQAAHTYWRRWYGEQLGLLPLPPDPQALERLTLPPITLQTAAGEPFRWEPADRPTLILIWSPASEASLVQLKAVRELAQHEHEDLNVVLVNVDHLPARHVGAEHDLPATESATRLATSNEWPHLAAWATMEAISSLRAHNPPVTVLLDRQGRIAHRLDYTRSTEELARMIKHLSDDDTPIILADTPDK